MTTVSRTMDIVRDFLVDGGQHCRREEKIIEAAQKKIYWQEEEPTSDEGSGRHAALRSRLSLSRLLLMMALALALMGTSYISTMHLHFYRSHYSTVEVRALRQNPQKIFASATRVTPAPPPADKRIIFKSSDESAQTYLSLPVATTTSSTPVPTNAPAPLPTTYPSLAPVTTASMIHLPTVLSSSRYSASQTTTTTTFGVVLVHCREKHSSMPWIDEIYRRVEAQPQVWNLTIYETCGQSILLSNASSSTTSSSSSSSSNGTSAQTTTITTASRFSQPFQNAGSEECSSYLQYCLELYDDPNLPDITIFLQSDGIRVKGNKDKRPPLQYFGTFCIYHV